MEVCILESLKPFRMNTCDRMSDNIGRNSL
jgi:hypothetical protein